MKKKIMLGFLVMIQLGFFLWVTGCNNARQPFSPQVGSSKVQAKDLLVPDDQCNYNSCFGPPFYTYASEISFTPVPCISYSIMTVCATKLAMVTATATDLIPTQTIIPTQTTIPTGTVTPATVDAVSVDANDPINTKVNYSIEFQGTIRNVTFSAPGVTNSSPSEAGNFFFTLDEHQLAVGDNLIILSASNIPAPVTVIASRSQFKAPRMGVEPKIVYYRVPVEDVDGFVLVPLIHEILEQYNLINYSAPTLSGSKTIWVGNSFVNLYNEENPNIPNEISGWSEDHYYQDLNGQYLRQPMSVYDPEPALIPASGSFESKNSTNDNFFAPGPLNTFEGSAQITALAFEDPAGLVFAQPSIFPPTDPIVAVPIQ